MKILNITHDILNINLYKASSYYIVLKISDILTIKKGFSSYDTNNRLKNHN